MKTNLYISLKPKMGENIYIDNIIHVNDIEETFNDHLNFTKSHGYEKIESLEGFKLTYLYLENVEFNGRKKKITQDDISKTLEKQGYVTFTGASGMFGGYYRPTEKLINKLNEQFKHRKELINQGNYINLKDIA